MGNTDLVGWVAGTHSGNAVKCHSGDNVVDTSRKAFQRHGENPAACTQAPTVPHFGRLPRNSAGSFGRTMVALGGLSPSWHVWSESEDCLPFLQLAQDYISSCGKKTLHEILEKVFKSFRPLLGLPDVDDDAFEEYNADVEEEEPEADHQQMGVSQQ
ncbi:PREDICTED: maturin [Charadrius vociferus]|uniref:maturin n=1 Tax=Charadrius vociferus TaxID=50402 RepID=UPI0005211DA3|nr:PREDICTED: maturin [Charadrius vociferus]